MLAWEILKTIWGQLSVTTYYVELCQDNMGKRPQRQWSLRKKCQSIGSYIIQSYTVSAVMNSLRTLKKGFCYATANHLTGGSLWSVLETYNHKQANLFLGTCISKIRCQLFLYICYKLYHMENRNLLWWDLSENRLCLYLSSSDDMQKELFFLQAWPFVLTNCSEGIWREVRLQDKQQHLLHCLYCKDATDQRITSSLSDLKHWSLITIYLHI